MKKIIAIPLLVLPFLITTFDTDCFRINEEVSSVEFKLYSSAFKDGDFIPLKYTCDGLNISPPLNWINTPGKSKTLALICDDPDAPVGDWVHWIVYNIPANVTEFKEEASSEKLLPQGCVEGINDFRKNHYGGPCPPAGIHRYFFKLYALDISLQSKDGFTKKLLLEAMRGHILAEASLMGKYKRR